MFAKRFYNCLKKTPHNSELFWLQPLFDQGNLGPALPYGSNHILSLGLWLSACEWGKVN